MRFNLLFVAIPMLVQLTNGCAGPMPTDVEIAVMDHQTFQGHCLRGVEDANVECHVFTVAIMTGPGPGNRVSTAASSWSASNAAQTHWAAVMAVDVDPKEHGYVAEASNATVHVGFATPLDTVLVQLRLANAATTDIDATET